MGNGVREPAERRAHERERPAADRADLAARLRTGSPLRVLNMSPDGMLVESPARLLPGRQVNLVVDDGAHREQAPWVVVHSRVGCMRGSSDLQYRAGLRRTAGTHYPHHSEPRTRGHELPAALPGQRPVGQANTDKPECRPFGIGFGRQDRT